MLMSHPKVSHLALAVALGTAAASAHAASPTPWREWNGKSYRLEADGNLSCYSTDREHCHGAVRPADAREDTDRPLTCGVLHRAKWGNTGYDQPGHWCNAAYANLFAQWHNYRALGLRVQIAFNPAGYAMCQSTNGRDCIWNDDSDTPGHLGTIDPLVCNAGVPGTALSFSARAVDSAAAATSRLSSAHWCDTREIVAQSRRPTLEGADYGRGNAELFFPTLSMGDQPAWIVRAAVPRQRASLDMYVVGESRHGDGGLSYMGAALSGDIVRVYATPLEFTQATSQPVSEQVTMALWLDREGSPHYVFKNGWSDDSIRDANADLADSALMESLLPPSRRLTRLTSGLRVELATKETGALPPGAMIEEIIATRVRTPAP